jgi:tyrosinase
MIANPLRSFVFTAPVADRLSPIPDADYSKPRGYETVRYPLSGLVGSDEDRAATAKHNAQYPNYAENVRLLNNNVIAWLTSHIVVGGKTIETNVKQKYIDCLNAPNYTVFSNTTSAQAWRDEYQSAVEPLESPHNSIHLAVGGVDIPVQDDSPIEGANGDMGENDTAGLDPIFYFHHAFVDRVFWLWQKKHGYTDRLEIIPEYPGTNSVDNQGPTPGVAPNSWLTINSPLNPFKHADTGSPFTSVECVNIERQLGYSYAPGSLEDQLDAKVFTKRISKAVHVSGIDRGRIRGSFLIAAFAKVGKHKYYLGGEAVLSRWNVTGCANCQTHLEARAVFSLDQLPEQFVQEADFRVEVRTRDGLLKKPMKAPALESKFIVEVR